MRNDKRAALAERLLLENYERYYRLAYSYTGNREDALDVVQESACKAIRDCGSVEREEYMGTWLYRVVVNTALDLLRKRRRETLPGDEMPEEVWEDTYENLDLAAMLRCLDEKSRTVVLLRYFEDMKLEDVARTLGENLNTVKARLYRALKKLRVNLDETENMEEGARV